MSTLLGPRARARDRWQMGRAETKVTRLFAEHRTVAGLPSGSGFHSGSTVRGREKASAARATSGGGQMPASAQATA